MTKEEENVSGSPKEVLKTETLIADLANYGQDFFQRLQDLGVNDDWQEPRPGLSARLWTQHDSYPGFCYASILIPKNTLSTPEILSVSWAVAISSDDLPAGFLWDRYFSIESRLDQRRINFNREPDYAKIVSELQDFLPRGKTIKEQRFWQRHDDTQEILTLTKSTSDQRGKVTVEVPYRWRKKELPAGMARIDGDIKLNYEAALSRYGLSLATPESPRPFESRSLVSKTILLLRTLSTQVFLPDLLREEFAFLKETSNQALDLLTNALGRDTVKPEAEGMSPDLLLR